MHVEDVATMPCKHRKQAGVCRVECKLGSASSPITAAASLQCLGLPFLPVLQYIAFLNHVAWPVQWRHASTTLDLMVFCPRSAELHVYTGSVPFRTSEIDPRQLLSLHARFVARTACTREGFFNLSCLHLSQLDRYVSRMQAGSSNTTVAEEGSN